MSDSQAERKRKLEALKARRKESQAANALLKDLEPQGESLAKETEGKLPGADVVMGEDGPGGVERDSSPRGNSAAPPLVIGWGIGDPPSSGQSKRGKNPTFPRPRGQAAPKGRQRLGNDTTPGNVGYAPQPIPGVVTRPSPLVDGGASPHPLQNVAMFAPPGVPIAVAPPHVNGAWQVIPPPGAVPAAVVQHQPGDPWAGLPPPPAGHAYSSAPPGFQGPLVPVSSSATPNPTPSLVLVSPAPPGVQMVMLPPPGNPPPLPYPVSPSSFASPGYRGGMGGGRGRGGRGPPGSSGRGPTPGRGAYRRGSGENEERTKFSPRGGFHKSDGKGRDFDDDGGVSGGRGAGQHGYFKKSFVEDPWRDLLAQGPPQSFTF